MLEGSTSEAIGQGRPSTGFACTARATVEEHGCQACSGQTIRHLALYYSQQKGFQTISKQAGVPTGRMPTHSAAAAPSAAREAARKESIRQAILHCHSGRLFMGTLLE